MYLKLDVLHLVEFRLLFFPSRVLKFFGIQTFYFSGNTIQSSIHNNSFKSVDEKHLLYIFQLNRLNNNCIMNWISIEELKPHYHKISSIV